MEATGKTVGNVSVEAVGMLIAEGADMWDVARECVFSHAPGACLWEMGDLGAELVGGGVGAAAAAKACPAKNALCAAVIATGIARGADAGGDRYRDTTATIGRWWIEDADAFAGAGRPAVDPYAPSGVGGLYNVYPGAGGGVGLHQ